MKRVWWLVGAAVSVLPLLSCNGGDDGAGPSPDASGPGVWVADEGAVWKFTLDGGLKQKTGGFDTAWDVAVREADGAAWVADIGRGTVTKFTDAGAVAKTVNGMGWPYGVSVNQNDGSCWVVDEKNGRAYKLDAQGNVKKTAGGFDQPYDLACYSGDGACWVSDSWNSRLVKLDANGNTLFTRDLGDPVWCVAVDPRDGSCWASTLFHLYKYSAAGGLLADVGTNNSANGIAVAEDGAVVYTTDGKLFKRDADGHLKWTRSGFSRAVGVAVSTADGSIWVADEDAKKVVKYSKSGDKMSEVAAGFADPRGVGLHSQ